MSLNVTLEDLSLAKPAIFEPKEVVEFVCLDADENVQYQALNLRCKVLSGQNRGKRHGIRINMKKANDIQKRKLATFALAFYTEEEITKGETPLARLVGRKFSGVAEAPRDWRGKTFQDFDYFKDLGEASSEETSAELAPEAPSPESDIPF